MLLVVIPCVFALDADTFSFSGSTLDVQGGLQQEAPDVGWVHSGYGGLGIVYAHNPVIYTSGSPLVSDQFGVHLLGGYTAFEAARFEIDAPIYPVVTWEDQVGTASGDIAVRGIFSAVRRKETGFSLGARTSVSLPSGDARWLAGGGGFGVSETALLAFAPSAKLDLRANLGYSVTPISRLGGQEYGSHFDYGLGVAYRAAEALLVGGEFNGMVRGSERGSPAELDVYGTWGKQSGLTTTAALGTGIVAGVGAPDFRFVLSGGWRFAGTKPVYDQDKDGVEDESDACIDVPEDHDDFEDDDGCPDDDNDRDTIRDADDTCPTRAEDFDHHEDNDGCPDDDNDGDGVVDHDDLCRDVPGTRDTHGCPDSDADGVADGDDQCPGDPGPAALNGCPDRDQDLVHDGRDKCPDVPKDAAEDPKRSDGCPHRVFVTVDHIEIKDRIYFDTGKTTIQAKSFGLLEEIARTINGVPDIGHIEVRGHTDNVGSDKKNLTLSDGRAKAVVAWLVTNGKVDAKRLVGIGIGEAAPIDTNNTEAGRANNRRVEFAITK